MIHIVVDKSADNAKLIRFVKFHSMINTILFLSYLKVMLNSSVYRLQQAADHVVVTCENGKSYRAEFVISAMPQVLLNSVSFDPPLPPVKNQLIQRIPMGSIIKTVTFYKRAFWREKELSGLLCSDAGPAYIAVDDTKPDGSCPAIMRLVTCEFGQMRARRRKGRVLVYPLIAVEISVKPQGSGILVSALQN